METLLHKVDRNLYRSFGFPLQNLIVPGGGGVSSRGDLIRPDVLLSFALFFRSSGGVKKGGSEAKIEIEWR